MCILRGQLRRRAFRQTEQFCFLGDWGYEGPIPGKRVCMELTSWLCDFSRLRMQLRELVVSCIPLRSCSIESTPVCGRELGSKVASRERRSLRLRKEASETWLCVMLMGRGQEQQLNLSSPSTAGLFFFEAQSE
ncbi:hypothetical protein TNCT_495711 [Trichonephila clavata]|uniref:Uncharacterized protein n=1 Tax=Trichonephila clavata TaxID=2740835 RepID=A0A8X6HRP5_TRICU|nr:hypothetical protein TNCT_495711 [Trichonephila clavata]